MTIDATRRVVTIRFEGAVTLEVLEAGREALAREPGWSPRFAHVFDFRAITDLDLPTEAIRKLASRPPIFDRTAPQILIARRGSFEYGLAATFGALAADRRNVHVVPSMDDAVEILEKSNW